MDFSENVWSNRLEEHLVQQGAACITILTFQHNDNNQSAGAALARVWKAAKEPGFQQIKRGECNPRLLSKAQEIFQEDEKAADDQMLAEKTQEAIKLSLKEMSDKMVTKEDLKQEIIKTHEHSSHDTGKVLESISLVEDSVKKTIVEDTGKLLDSINTVEENVKKTIAEDRVDTARMLQRTEQAERISHEMSGRVGGETSRRVRSLKRELAASHQENAKLRRQMQDRDKMMAERDNRLNERLGRLEASLVERDNRVYERLGRMEVSQVERDNRLDGRLGRIEARI